MGLQGWNNIVTLIGGILAILVTLGVGKFVHWLVRRPQTRFRGNRARVYQTGLALQKMIEHERHNFEHIQEGKPYSGEPHRRAVEDVSFEGLLWRLEEFLPARVFGFRRLCLSVKCAIEKIHAMPQGQKDVSDLMPLLDKLEPRLDRFLKPLEITLPPSE